MIRRHAVLLPLAAVFVVLALLTAFALELSDTQVKSKQDVKVRVHERAVLAAALIDSLFQAAGQQVPQQAQKYGAATVSSRTMDADRSRGGSTYIALLDPSRRVLAHSRGFTAQARANLSQSAALKLIGAGRPYALGDVLPYGKTGVINLAVVLPTRSGKRILLTGFAPSALSGFIGGELRKIPGVKGAQNYLIDGRRNVVASTNPKLKLGHAFGSRQQADALSRLAGEVDGSYYDQVRLTNSTLRIVLVAPDGPLFASVSGLRKWVPWMIFIAFALVAIVAVMLGRRALRARDELRSANVHLEAVIAELATTNATLERRAAELARSNEELDQFASIASHDLQEPLRKVRTFTQQVTVMESEQLSEKGRDYLDRANAAAERMQKLIEDLLRFSRVATNARPFAAVDLATITREVLEDLETEVDRSGAVVRVSNLPTVSGDELQLRQLMQNLVSNALKFRRDGVAPEIAIEGSVAGDAATITVRDNGIGFDPQYSLRIFRVFERLHGRGQYPGTGIGLALCRKIVERHGGAIVADSEPGAGAVFSVTLPINQREEVIAISSHRDDVESSSHDGELVHG